MGRTTHYYCMCIQSPATSGTLACPTCFRTVCMLKPLSPLGCHPGGGQRCTVTHARGTVAQQCWFRFPFLRVLGCHCIRPVLHNPSYQRGLRVGWAGKTTNRLGTPADYLSQNVTRTFGPLPKHIYTRHHACPRSTTQYNICTKVSNPPGS